MTTFLIQITTLVVTVLFSGVVSAVVAHKLSADRAERDFRRKKLEEVFVAVHRYCQTLFSANIIWTKVMNAEMDFNDALKFQIDTLQGKGTDHETSVMLINIYFPELNPLLDSIFKRRDEINQIRTEFQKCYEAGLPCGVFVQPLLGQLKFIDEDEKKITQLIFQISKTLK